jgi:hypothetical protein
VGKIRRRGGDDAAQQDDYLGDAMVMSDIDGPGSGRRGFRGNVPKLTVVS